MISKKSAGLKVKNLLRLASIDVRADDDLNCNVGPGQVKRVPPVGRRTTPDKIRLDALEPASSVMAAGGVSRSTPITIEFHRPYDVTIKYREGAPANVEADGGDGASKSWELDFAEPDIQLAAAAAKSGDEEDPIGISVGPDEPPAPLYAMSTVVGVGLISATIAWLISCLVKRFGEDIWPFIPIILAVIGIITLIAGKKKNPEKEDL